MTPQQFYHAYSKDHVQGVAQAARTTFHNFQQIALAGGSVSKGLAERLAAASDGEMTEMEILYPERFNGDSAA